MRRGGTVSPWIDVPCCLCVFWLIATRTVTAQALDGTVFDADTRTPVAAAILTSATETVQAGPDGRFHLERAGETVRVRAPGYRRAEARIDPGRRVPVRLELKPFQPKAVYLSVFGIGSNSLRDAALQLIEHTELNALVIDVKGDRG